VVVAHSHLRDVAALVILIFFFAYRTDFDGIGSILDTISLDTVGRDLDQLRYSFDGTASLEFDFGSFSFDSTARKSRMVWSAPCVESRLKLPKLNSRMGVLSKDYRNWSSSRPTVSRETVSRTLPIPSKSVL